MQRSSTVAGANLHRDRIGLETNLPISKRKMITVTLGTIFFPFDRAAEWLDVLLERDFIVEPVLFQHGSTSVARLNHPLLTTVPSLTREEMRKAVLSSSLVISHAGQGSTRMLCEMGARFILLPRLKRYREHVDDHQLLFARAVTKYGIHHCNKFEQLVDFVRQPPTPSQRALFQVPSLVDYLIDSVAS